MSEDNLNEMVIAEVTRYDARVAQLERALRELVARVERGSREFSTSEDRAILWRAKQALL